MQTQYNADETFRSWRVQNMLIGMRLNPVEIKQVQASFKGGYLRAMEFIGDLAKTKQQTKERR